MNRNQYFVLGTGLLFLSSYLFLMTNPCYSLISSDAVLISCYIRRYAYGIPAIISIFLGWLFIICGWLEPKKKHIRK